MLPANARLSIWAHIFNLCYIPDKYQTNCCPDVKRRLEIFSYNHQGMYAYKTRFVSFVSFQLNLATPHYLPRITLLTRKVFWQLCRCIQVLPQRNTWSPPLRTRRTILLPSVITMAHNGPKLYRLASSCWMRWRPIAWVRRIRRELCDFHLQLFQPLSETIVATLLGPLGLESAKSLVPNCFQNEEYREHNDLCCVCDEHLWSSDFRIPPRGAAKHKHH